MPKAEPENTNAWYKMLEIAKDLSGDQKSDFTAEEFAQRAAIAKSGSSSPNQIASAWICKLRDWGYVETNGTVVKGPGRPINLYRITDKGLECQPEPGLRQRLQDAIEAFRLVYGTRDQDRGFRELIRTAQEVKEEFSRKRIQ